MATSIYRFLDEIKCKLNASTWGMGGVWFVESVTVVILFPNQYFFLFWNAYNVKKKKIVCIACLESVSYAEDI